MTTSAPSPDQAVTGQTEDIKYALDNDAENARRESRHFSDVLVRISHVTKYYGRFKALDDVSLDVHRGEVVVVIGSSGSGKSTLCRTVNRLEPIQDGEIEIDGIPLPQEGRGLESFLLLPLRVNGQTVAVMVAGDADETRFTPDLPLDWMRELAACTVAALARAGGWQ